MTSSAEIHHALLESAQRLKKMAPHEWGTFLQSLSASAEIDNENLLSAEPSSILHAQGRAVAMQQLCLNLATADEQLARAANIAKRTR
ncbi:hypothetical protein [Methylobacterium fujisawaense]